MGDLFTFDSLYIINFSGFSSSFPFIISSYDENCAVSTYGPDPIQSTRARPMIAYTNTVNVAIAGSTTQPNGLDYTAIVGIDFYASWRDPNNSTVNPVYNNFHDGAFQGAIEMNNNFNWMLIEDCRFRFYGNNPVDISPDFAGHGYLGHNLIVRRNQIMT